MRQAEHATARRRTRRPCTAKCILPTARTRQNVTGANSEGEIESAISSHCKGAQQRSLPPAMHPLPHTHSQNMEGHRGANAMVRRRHGLYREVKSQSSDAQVRCNGTKSCTKAFKGAMKEGGELTAKQGGMIPAGSQNGEARSAHPTTKGSHESTEAGGHTKITA
jgi:hypothetical protein